MKSLLAVLLLILSLNLSGYSQVRLPELISGKTGNLTQSEAGDGIKVALNQGITKAVGNLNRVDGFFGNSLYKLLLPPEFAKAERMLRAAGLGKEVDRAILAINRGAEDAVGQATPIFVSAIKSMKLTDAISIVKGNERAATDYFQQKTSDSLRVAFTPSVKTSLDKTEATRYYGDIVNAYNKLPTTFKKMNPDLSSYVVDKTLSALFDQIATQETLIRKDPAAQTTTLLQKVFGKN